jgi:hypothetical protein
VFIICWLYGIIRRESKCQITRYTDGQSLKRDKKWQKESFRIIIVL